MSIVRTSADTPLLATLSRFAASFATSPTRGAVRRLASTDGSLTPTAPLVGEVAELGPQVRSVAGRGVCVDFDATHPAIQIPHRGSFVVPTP